MAPRGSDFWRSSGAVRLELDLSDIDKIVRELGATPELVRKSISRALRRTASALRMRSLKAARDTLQMRNATAFRRRLKDLRVRMHKSGGEVGVWIGLNDLPVSALKGRMREYSGGATFRSKELPDAFVATHKGKRSIYRRKGKRRFPIIEQTYPIKDQMDVVLEDEVFPDAIEIFMRNFASDLRARTVFGVGK